jgi:hypothetical protein
MFAEFRVYVQVDQTQDRSLLRLRDFIRACIENLDGVSAVEVEPPRGSLLRDTADREVLGAETSTH